MSRSATGARAKGSAGAKGSTEKRAATAGDGSGSPKYVYEFSEGSRELRDLLGGKGAGLAEMVRVLPAGRVPSGFTITTEACIAYLSGAAPEELEGEVDAALALLESSAGRRLGDPNDPLLASVRSGARVSMPGMMDTVLNLGLNDDSVEGLAGRTENPRFAWDSYRRFCQMFGNVVRGVDGGRFEELIEEAKRERGVELDTELGEDDLRGLTARFRALVEDATGAPIPSQPREQLREAIEAVFSSWNNRRAIEYRRLEGIPDDWGTAVTVQEMVFGNTGPDSGSGVAFSRDSLTGAEIPSGDFLFNAQGEDVVAGVRNPGDLETLRERLPEVHRDLLDDIRLLERHYRDMQDVEFTVEDGRLYMLQTRAAKRPAQAAVRFACDAVAEGLLTEEAALRTIDADRLETLLHPTFDPDAEYEVLARGVAASPGAARGAIVFSATDAVAAAGRGEKVILVRPFTEADDVAGFAAAQGIVTSEGGRASHAALVARGMGKPCVSGAGLRIDPAAGAVEADGQTLGAGDVIAIDGSAGVVTRDPVEFVEPGATEELDRVLGWADDVRRLGVRANADTPDDAKRAIGFGAEGIGLCRTEHMFFGEDRDQLVRDLFLAVERRRRALAATPTDPTEVEATERESVQALDGLRRLQVSDFERILETMDGRPVTIRLLDPPLHEFLPSELYRRELAEIEDGGDESAAEAARDRLELVEQLERGQSDAGHEGQPARDPLPRALRDAGRRDPRGSAGDETSRHPGRARDHAAADRLRAGADRASGAGRAGGLGGDRSRRRAARLPDRDDDRAAPRLPRR